MPTGCVRSLPDMQRLVVKNLGEIGGNPSGMPGPKQQAGGLAIGHTLLALEMWLEASSTSSDLISEVSSIADSEIRNLDFMHNSINVGDSTIQVVELSVHQGPVGGTFAILAMEQALTMDIVVPAPQ